MAYSEIAVPSGKRFVAILKGKGSSKKFRTGIMQNHGANVLPDSHEYLDFDTLSALTGWTKIVIKVMKVRGKFTRIAYVDSTRGGAGGKRPLIHISDPAIPAEARAKYLATHPVSIKEDAGPGSSTVEDLSEAEIESDVYASLPQWARRKVDKYITLLNATAGMKGAEMRRYIEDVWNVKHPDDRSSYQRVVDARKVYRKEGVMGLAGKYGRLSNRKEQPVLIQENWFEYFKSQFLVEGGPSEKACWYKTLGFARRQNPTMNVEQFPTVVTFSRRLKKEVPEEAIFLARYGRAAWNRRYAPYNDRDMTTLIANSCWVGDHHQVDVAVRFPSGKVGFAWLTAWIDFKTSKWIGWYIHPEAPNSDHIFFSFYKGARRYGVPTDIYIDNGKDYRAKDFAGGRTFLHHVAVEEGKSTAMVAQLGITPHFSLPYRAQSKTIERQFLKVKEWISKGMPGYRGGNTVEKPEKLAGEIKAGKILEWDEYLRLMTFSIEKVLNQIPSTGKALAGRSPDEAFALEAPVFRMVGADALKLFCMRTSRPVTIGRNGVRDSEIARTYWGEWMFPLKGTKVYLRRDPDAYQDAWVFRADTDEYLGMATMAEQIDALARTPESKARLKDAQARNRKHEKLINSFLPDPESAPAPAVALEDFAGGIAAVNELRGYMPAAEGGTVIAPARTAMDDVIAKKKEMERVGTDDLSLIVPMPERKKKLFASEVDRDLYLAAQVHQ